MAEYESRYKEVARKSGKNLMSKDMRLTTVIEQYFYANSDDFYWNLLCK